MWGKVFTIMRTTMAAVLFLLPIIAGAQPKSIGTVPSLLSYGIVYDHWDAGRPNTFHSVVVKSDIKGLLQDKLYFPGMSAEYSYNFCRIKTLDQGGDIRFYCGPGVIAGWQRDYKAPCGLTLGVKMDLGIEYASACTPISIGARLTPTVGVHARKKHDDIVLSVYKYGLVRTLIPEITMKYEFGSHTNLAADYDYFDADSDPNKDSGVNGPGNGFNADSGRSKGSNGRQDRNTRAERRRARSFPLFTFGLSYNYSPTTIIFTHYNYVDEDIVRHFKKEYRFTYKSRGNIIATVGVNCGKYINISLGSGYSGVGNGGGYIPLLLRVSGYIGNNPLRNRPFVYADGGVGFSLRNETKGPAILATTGGGYRFSLDKHAKLDFSAGIFVAHDHPVMPDSINTTISDELAIGFSLCSAIVF